MSMFDMGGVATVKTNEVSTGANYLKAGIHNVIFKAVNKAETLNVIELQFEAVDGSGIHNERIFEPTSVERKESQYGINPSQVEQFMCKIKAIIDALNPEVGKRIEDGSVKIQAPDFDSFVKLIVKILTPAIGKITNIKLVPTTGNYVGLPGFIARVGKDGNLYVNNKIIGDDLVLSNKEKNAIEAAANAKPTNMATYKSNDDELADLKEDFDVDETSKKDDGLDGLPF